MSICQSSISLNVTVTVTRDGDVYVRGARLEGYVLHEPTDRLVAVLGEAVKAVAELDALATERTNKRREFEPSHIHERHFKATTTQKNTSKPKTILLLQEGI